MQHPFVLIYKKVAQLQARNLLVWHTINMRLMKTRNSLSSSTKKFTVGSLQVPRVRRRKDLVQDFIACCSDHQQNEPIKCCKLDEPETEIFLFFFSLTCIIDTSHARNSISCSEENLSMKQTAKNIENGHGSYAGIIYVSFHSVSFHSRVSWICTKAQ